jgi:hypothetical protein
VKGCGTGSTTNRSDNKPWWGIATRNLQSQFGGGGSANNVTINMDLRHRRRCRLGRVRAAPALVVHDLLGH